MTLLLAIQLVVGGFGLGFMAAILLDVFVLDSNQERES